MRIRSGVLSLLVASALFGCAHTPHDGPHQTVHPEAFRAVWVDSWGPGLYTEEECDQLVEWCVQHDFNTIIAEVRKIGDAYYRSTLEPPGVNAETERPLVTGFDPLGYLVERAHKHPGLRVEAWIVANRIWKGAKEPVPGWPRHAMHAHPEWILKERNGGTKLGDADGSTFFDPSEEGVRRHTAQVAADIARRYDVDAIHLDYIRYPGRDWGYGRRSLTRFRLATGFEGTPEPDDPSFTRWRAEQVTREVRDISAAIQRARDGVELTVATVTWGDPGAGGYRQTRGYTDAMQDWPSWCDAGLVDVVYVMHYKREHDAAQRSSYRDWFDTMLPLRSERTDVVVGTGAYLNDVGDTVVQVRDALDAGFDGFAIFSYRSPGRTKIDIDALGRSLSRIR